jgi:hypothetical protein
MYGYDSACYMSFLLNTVNLDVERKDFISMTRISWRFFKTE